MNIQALPPDRQRSLDEQVAILLRHERELQSLHGEFSTYTIVVRQGENERRVSDGMAQRLRLQRERRRQPQDPVEGSGV